MDVVIDPIQDLEPVGGRGLADKAARPDEPASATPGREAPSPGQAVGDKTASSGADKAAGEGQAPMSTGRARDGRAHALGEAPAGELPDSEKQKRSLAIETARKRCVSCLPWSAVGGVWACGWACGWARACAVARARVSACMGVLASVLDCGGRVLCTLTPLARAYV